MKLSEIIWKTKRQDWARDNPLVRGVGGFLMRRLLLLGALTWGTKSYEFWTFLTLVLAVVRPRSLVELGSGRSTSYLAEYAAKRDVPFVSIEQNPFYVRKIKRGLRNSFLSDRFVHRVRLGDDGWYDAARVSRLVSFTPDLLFVDGPIGVDEGLGRGIRTSENAERWLAQAASQARIVIVDDVLRPANRELFERLLGRNPGQAALYLSYPGEVGQRNVLAVSVPADHLDRLGRLARDTGVATFDSVEAARA